jgi:gamma-glutamylcyclotransferase (GGCT)/AIG2-like uncharacterized protein YtfP
MLYSKNMMRHYYFAYGMNTNPEEMARRCSDSKALGRADLEGYRFVFRGHADVELADPDEYVEGVLWEVSNDDLYQLDWLEGFPDYYLRQRVKVQFEGEEYIAWVYTMQDQSFKSGPSETYYNMCKTGYEYFGVDTDQIQEALGYVRA